MTGPVDPTLEFLNAIRAHLDKDVQRGVDALTKIMARFPGQTPADIDKSVASLQASSRTSVPAMVERARGLIQAEMPPGDSIELFLKDAAKLDANDLQAIAGQISLAVPKQKKSILAELRQWLESRGTYAPKSPLEKAKERARELAHDLPERMIHMTAELAAEVMRRAEAAAMDKALGADGFAEFAAIVLGAPAKGSRPVLLKQIRARVDRLAASYAQSTSA
jgi:hypothetical protein